MTDDIFERWNQFIMESDNPDLNRFKSLLETIKREADYIYGTLPFDEDRAKQLFDDLNNVVRNIQKRSMR